MSLPIRIHSTPAFQSVEGFYAERKTKKAADARQAFAAAREYRIVPAHLALAAVNKSDRQPAKYWSTAIRVSVNWH